jgi:hypothetical protein
MAVFLVAIAVLALGYGVYRAVQSRKADSVVPPNDPTSPGEPKNPDPVGKPQV